MSVFQTLILEKVIGLWINLVMSTEACDVLGHGSRYVWGLSQVPVNTEALWLCRTTSLPFIPGGVEARSHGFDGISGIPASHYSHFSII